ncbi:MAG: hypothetical protein RMK84_19420 [Oscillochloridaceae bacterium]|nr:carboxypeptidase-like regulatory domain-containing protein [Chloroflexaceae bacterium]MDW8392297.1 hypothetical protein [Oscillochloridaceae bacterium]
MQRQIVSVTLMLCGAILLMLGMVVVPAPAAVAGPALQPSPRPPLEPTAPPEGGLPAPTPVPYGRVTGTIIDLRTGAPAPGKLVVIGDSTVISDANGNYDRWVVSGFYDLYLRLRDGEGRVAQPPQQIAVGNGDTVVVHLFFTSEAPVTPAAPEPTATAAPAPAATAAPTAIPTPTPREAVAVVPVSLPTTAATSASVPGPLLLAGAALLVLGALLQVRPRRRAARRHEADQRLLRRMLATPPEEASEE